MTGELTFADRRWWTPEFDGDARHDAVIRVVEEIQDRQEYRGRADLSHARLYDNAPMVGLSPYGYTRTDPLDTETLALNVVRNAIDARTAKVIRNKPKPTFLTENGNWAMQKKAKNLQKWVEGQFYETKLYDLDAQLCTDAGVFGTGIVKPYIAGKSIKIDRVFPWELIVDDVEAQYGKPRCVYQRKFIDRLELIASFTTGLPAEERDRLELLLRQTKTDDHRDSVLGATSADLVLVTEAWHLRSGPEATDGRHVICVENAELLDEPYDRDGFPFVLLREKPPRQGIWGDSLASQLAGIQYEINKLLLQIQQGHDLITGQWLAEKSAGVLTTHINNDLARIVEYAGIPPQYIVPAIIAPEVYQHLWQLYAKAYEISGISQMSATSQKPAGLNSGKALQTYDDIDTERFVTFGREREQFYLEVADHLIELGKELPQVPVKAHGKRNIVPIKWSDVNMKRDEYVMKAYPTSSMPSTVAGKLQVLADLKAAAPGTGDDVVDPAEFRMLLDFPDLDASTNLVTASREIVDEILDRMLDAEDPNAEDAYQAPDPFMDLGYTLKHSINKYLRAKIDGAPEGNLQLVRDFIQQTKDLLNPPPPPLPGGMGPAMPANDVTGAPPANMNGVPPAPMAANGGPIPFPHPGTPPPGEPIQ